MPQFTPALIYGICKSRGTIKMHVRLRHISPGQASISPLSAGRRQRSTCNWASGGACKGYANILFLITYSKTYFSLLSEPFSALFIELIKKKLLNFMLNAFPTPPVPKTTVKSLASLPMAYCFYHNETNEKGTAVSRQTFDQVYNEVKGLDKDVS